jgi:hypothetical protein
MSCIHVIELGIQNVTKAGLEGCALLAAIPRYYETTAHKGGPQRVIGHRLGILKLKLFYISTPVGEETNLKLSQ